MATVGPVEKELSKFICRHLWFIPYLTLTGDEETDLPKANETGAETKAEAQSEAEPKGENENGDKKSEDGSEMEDKRKVIPLLRSAGDVHFF